MATSTRRTGFDAGFPVSGPGRDKLGFAVRQAMFATTVRDWQPVEFQVQDQFVEISARNPQAAGVFDFEGREAMIQCGMALQQLKLTLKQHGCFGRMDLFPDLDQPELAARVYLGWGGARDDFEQQLFGALEAGTESSSRLPMPISEAALAALCRATSGERVWLEFARSEGSRQRLVDLLYAANRARATEIQVQPAAPVRSAEGVWGLGRFAGGRLSERFSRWRKPTVAIRMHAPIPPSQEPFEAKEPVGREATFAVLKTKTDDKHGWCAAGQTLSRLLLQSRKLGLPCTPFVGVMRQPELRMKLRTAIGHKGFTQVLLCFAAPHIVPTQTVTMYPTTETRSST